MRNNGSPLLTIKNLIATANTRLTPTDRRIAEAVISDPTLLTFGTVSGLAEKVGTSPPSIVRFATKLGFEGFSELQQHAQSEFSEQVISPSQRVRQDHEGETQQKIERAMHHAFDELNSESLANMATPIVSAPQVFILSGETSMAGAYVLQSGLSMIRDNVMLIEEHATGRALCGAQQGDVAVVFDFSRYRRNSILASQTLGEHGVTIVAVTDSPLSPLAELTELRCELDIPAVGPFDSSVPAVIAAELIVSKVVQEMRDEARDRIDKLEALWQSTETFLNYSPREER